MYASVLIEIGAKSVDKLFTYIIPSNLINDVKIGTFWIHDFRGFCARNKKCV